MPSEFHRECEELFGRSDLYEIFHLERANVTDAKIKKAYRDQSMLCHPDRFASSEDERVRELATRKFQIVGRIYQILSDKEKRQIYDDTGLVDDDVVGVGKEDMDWMLVFRSMFKKFTVKDIDNYLQTYRGSTMEEDDIKAAYIKHKGNMDKIMMTVIGADAELENRIREIIDRLIAAKDLESFPAYANEPIQKREKRLKKAKSEQKQVEKLQKEGKVPTITDENDLVMQIQGKRRMDDMISQMEAKYGGNTGAGSSKSRKRKAPK